MSPAVRLSEDTSAPLTNHSTVASVLLASVLLVVNEQVSVTDVPNWTGVGWEDDSCDMVGAAGK